MAPIRGGDISGQFNGHLVPNVSVETERPLPSTNGEYTVSISGTVEVCTSTITQLADTF